MRASSARPGDLRRLVALSARLVAGRFFWVAPLLPSLWLAFQAFRLAAGWQAARFEPADAQNTLIGLPLTLLAIGLGVRIIADELDRRTLEIAYTVPGGSQRIWLAKLAAAALMVLASEAILALLAFAFFTGFPLAALHGALQAAISYMVTAMALAVLFKSEITGAMATVAVLGLNGLLTGFGGNQLRLSPFFNHLAIRDALPSELFAWLLQNRIGFLLFIAGVTALAFARAERRETLLRG